MKEIFINVDAYNRDSIKTIQGNNNAEVYKIYILSNKKKIDLTGKTVKMAYLRSETVEGDIINLEVTNAQEGEITLQITNAISKRNGVYSCQIAIYGADEFLEHTATFGLTVEANIFNKIANEIADSKDFTYLENILDKASELSEKLKENTSSATNANSNLESNITEANNINSKLLENTSIATNLNKSLESNIDLAKEVKETIKDLDTKNIEAAEKIETLEGLNNKAEELSDNINKGLPLNSELVKNTESAKTANNELIATNNDAKAKKTDLDNSLEEAKKYIAGLDGSQNIPQIRIDVTEIQNGLKSNQSLEYSGSSISANDTLEGRTEGMRIKGNTMYKKKDGAYTDKWEEGVTLESFGEKEDNKISILSRNYKNLFNKKNITFDSYIDFTGNIQSTSSGNCITDYIEFTNNKGFVSEIPNTTNGGNNKAGISYYDSNKIFIRSEISNNFTKPSNARYIRLTINKKDINTCVLEENNKIELKKEDKKDILIKEPLRSAGDVQDIIYEDDGKVKIDRYVGKIIINGNSDHGNNYIYYSDKRFIINIRELNINKKDRAYVLCDKLPYNYSAYYTIGQYGISGYGDSSASFVGRWDFGKTITDSATFIEYLKTNPITIYYELDTPVTEVVENCVDIDLDTYPKKTYFNILNSIPGGLDFKVPSNIGSVIQNMAKEVNNIWDVINNLLVPSLIDVNKTVAMTTIKNNLK